MESFTKMTLLFGTTHHTGHTSNRCQPYQINHIALACIIWGTLYYIGLCIKFPTHHIAPCIIFSTHHIPLHHNSATHFKSTTSLLCVILTQPDIFAFQLSKVQLKFFCYVPIQILYPNVFKSETSSQY